MEKPKTLEQLRAEKERAETQLAQEQHKLERLENRKNIWNSVYKPQFRQKRKRSRSPAGLRRLGTATRISASLSRRLSAFFGSTHDQAPKAAKYAVLTPGPGMFVNVQYVSRVVIAAPSGRSLFRRVGRCVRSCWRRRVCVPAFACKSKRGAFVPEVLKAV